MENQPIYISKDSTTSSSSHRRRWDISPRGSAEWSFEFTIHGRERIISPDGSATLVGEGAAVLIKPATPRNLGQAADCRNWTRFYCIFTPPPDWQRLLLWPEIYPGAMTLAFENPLRQKIEAALEQAHEVQRSAWEFRAEMTKNLMEQVLLWCHTANPASRHAGMHEGILKAMHFISRRFAEPIGIDEVARHAGLSRSHFIRLFHEQTGITPRRFIEDCRLGEATHLLRTRNLSAAEIAFACGFPDPSRFSRVFKSRTGQSPSELRCIRRSSKSARKTG
jgi:AraC-like DNA-binding protein